METMTIKRLFLFLTLCLTGLFSGMSCAQTVDTVMVEDTLYIHQQPFLNYQFRIDSLQHLLNESQTRYDTAATHFLYQMDLLRRRIAQLEKKRDSLWSANQSFQHDLGRKNELLEKTVSAFQEKEALFIEKESLYKEAISHSNVDKAKLEGQLETKNASIEAKNSQIDFLTARIVEKEESLKQQKQSYDKVIHEKESMTFLADSLRTRLNEAEKKIIQTNEALKYTERRAKEAEAKVEAAVSRKKKVCVIQGIAMKTFRTPSWSLAPRVNPETSRTEYVIVNRNAGSIEFDFITGASVMLWDLTKSFNGEPKAVKDSTQTKSRELPKFDQQFSYSLGIYVGFGGSNLFKNFYVGPSFKFLDFFHFTAGMNVCEYEVLREGVEEGSVLEAGSLDSQIVKAWKLKPFVSLSLDLDFISYIKK